MPPTLGVLQKRAAWIASESGGDVRPDQRVDLTARNPAFETPDDPAVLDQDDRRNRRHAELLDDSGATVGVYLEHRQLLLARDLDPRNQAFHPPRGSAPVTPDEEERRSRGGAGTHVASTGLLRLCPLFHLRVVPAAISLETMTLARETVRNAMTAAPMTIDARPVVDDGQLGIVAQAATQRSATAVDMGRNGRGDLGALELARRTTVERDRRPALALAHRHPELVGQTPQHTRQRLI